MASRFFGNRPDCAYYLMLGLCGAAVFTAFGGIFTYMGYWPEIAFNHHPEAAHNYLSHAPDPNYYTYKVSDTTTKVYAIVGPLCLVLGVGIALTVGILALKYDCEYEPEEPKVAIMRLASEMSLNMNGDSGTKYEVIRTPAPELSLQEQGPSQSAPGSGGFTV